MQEYTLGQMRGFADAIARAEAEADARRLNLQVLGRSGDVEAIERTLDALDRVASRS